MPLFRNNASKIRLLVQKKERARCSVNEGFTRRVQVPKGARGGACAKGLRWSSTG